MAPSLWTGRQKSFVSHSYGRCRPSLENFEVFGRTPIYVIVDQLVWRVPDSKDKDPKGVGIFGRVIGAPAQQNLVDFYADGGITFSGMIPHRANDILAVGFAYTGLGLDETPGLASARTNEALLEICYTARLKPGWTLQPDFQYIWQSSGGSDPSGKATIPNAAVWGVRTTINF